MAWVSVSERLPEIKELTKFRVKMRVGSIATKIVERSVLAKPTPSGSVRFITGDWTEVTHWQDPNKPNRQQLEDSRMHIECPKCCHIQDVSDCLPDRVCDDIEYECIDCEHKFMIGWRAEAELR